MERHAFFIVMYNIEDEQNPKHQCCILQGKTFTEMNQLVFDVNNLEGGHVSIDVVVRITTDQLSNPNAFVFVQEHWYHLSLVPILDDIVILKKTPNAPSTLTLQ